MSEKADEDSTTILDLTKKLEDAKNINITPITESPEDQEDISDKNAQNDDDKKTTKEKDKEVRKLKEEILNYKEKLEVTLVDFNAAKNEKRQLCNYLDDTKKLNQELIMKLERKEKDLCDNNLDQNKEKFDNPESNQGFALKSVLKSWDPLIDDKILVADDDNMSDQEESELSETKDEEHGDTNKKVTIAKENERKVQFAPNPDKIFTPVRSRGRKMETQKYEQNNQSISSNQRVNNQPICNYIRMGIPCTYNNRCRFRHNVTEDPKDQVCQYHLKWNQCRFGDKCRWYHVNKTDRKRLEQYSNQYWPSTEQYEQDVHQRNQFPKWNGNEQYQQEVQRHEFPKWNGNDHYYRQNNYGYKRNDNNMIQMDQGYNKNEYRSNGYNREWNQLENGNRGNDNSKDLSDKISFLEKSFLELTKKLIPQWNREESTMTHV